MGDDLLFGYDKKGGGEEKACFAKDVIERRHYVLDAYNYVFIYARAFETIGDDEKLDA